MCHINIHHQSYLLRKVTTKSTSDKSFYTRYLLNELNRTGAGIPIAIPIVIITREKEWT